MRPTNKKQNLQGQSKMEPCKRRNIILATKVNEEQQTLIKAKAAQCGMTVSDYLLSCACRYQPKARLTPEQARDIANLRDCRSDITRFFATFNSLSAEQRKEVVRGPANMLHWFRILADIGNKLSDFLERVGTPNRIPDPSNNLKNETEQ